MNVHKPQQFDRAKSAEAKSGKQAKEKKAGKPEKMGRKDYEKEMQKLQVELCYLQDWVRETGARVIIVCEGRDTAGKGGLIKRLVERVSPRTFQVVALNAPTEREKSMLYLQRYVQHFPAGGEVVIFDRSWYNRAGVERVMGFCTPKQARRFLQIAPMVEKAMVESGIILLKFWLEVSDKEQKRRFEARVNDPLRQWKLSAMDLPSRKRWFDYSRARDMMLDATDTRHAPWHVLRSDDKRRARLNCIRHLLSQISYKPVPREKVKLPSRSMKRALSGSKQFATITGEPSSAVASTTGFNRSQPTSG